MSVKWRAGERLLALVIVVGFVAATYLDRPSGIEGGLFSFITQLEVSDPRDDIVIVSLDDAIGTTGERNSWSRSVIAQIIDRVTSGRPRAIATTFTFEQPENAPALEVLDELSEKLAQTVGSERIDINPRRIDLARSERTGKTRSDAGFIVADSRPSLGTSLKALEQGLVRLRNVLDGDGVLAEAIRASGRFVVGIRALPQHGSDFGNGSLSRLIQVHSIAPPKDDAEATAVETGLIAPLPIVVREARDIGTLPMPVMDQPGAWALVQPTPYGFLPSMPLVLASRSLGLAPADIVINPGVGVSLGDMSLATDPRFRLWATGIGNHGTPPVDSATDLISGRIDPERYADRIVLIGATAPDADSSWLSVKGQPVPLAIALAQMTTALLNQDTAYRPDWAEWIDWGALTLVALYLLLVLPGLRPTHGIFISIALLITLAGMQIGALLGASIWFQVGTAMLMLLSGHAVLAARRGLFVAETPVAHAGAQSSGGPSEGSRRQIAQLDQAFERLQRMPLDGSIMEELYELGLAYERERMPRKSAAVYRYIAAHNPRFRDVKDKIRALNARSTYTDNPTESGEEQSSENTGRGSLGAGTLGRYRIERELGQGAMGIVYLGTDSKIGRTVAIKTMALSSEFEEDELGTVKERFFREAETAGRLNHPNIVTIYDVGEDQDLAYIAMEYLDGRNLGAFTRADRLLPLDQVLEMMAQCADTLAFAHARNVVHRDIKPANVMFEPVTGALKITDFGIARITDSSKTKRGMVLGTPSYMSPEQLAGQQVDGRSDLFSLGVMLFQMITGQLPFRAESMASLMFKIANEAHTPIRALRPDAPPCVHSIIDKALGKQVSTRYQDGTQMARDLRECAKKITM